jgi:hypothetical protein
MTSKTSPEGLHHQIDELDALLDRLLKLPLGPAPAPPPSTPVLKLAQPGDSLLEVMDEALDIDVPVLRLPPREEIPEPTEEPDRPHLAPLTNEFGTFPHLDADARVTEPPILSLPDMPPEPTVNRLDTKDIPWLDDEPAATPVAEKTAKPDPLPPITGSPAAGPRIEIIQGSLTTSVLLGDGSLEETMLAPAGWLRRTAWLFTWLFDVTVGLWFPGLRRTAGRRFLALAGLGLLGTSCYLAWKWWR